MHQIENSETLGPIFTDRFAFINRSVMNGYNGVGCFSYICDSEIGKFVHIGARCSIGASNHPSSWLSISNFQYQDTRKSWGINIVDSTSRKSFIDKKITRIGNDVWIGDNTVVLRGVEIGDGAIIGAGSVVTKNIDPYTINFGNPCKFHKFRFTNDIIIRLIKLKWWNMELELLNGIQFDNIEKAVEILEKYKSY